MGCWYAVYADAAPFAGHLESSHYLACDADTRTWIDDTLAERWAHVPASARAPFDPLDSP